MATTTSSRELDQTPTWAVAGICAIIIIISISLEYILHKIGTWLTNKRKNALFEALEKVKSELMVLGFISLLLTFFQAYILKVCISSTLADTMLPCPPNGESDGSTSRRRLLWIDHPRRSLAVTNTINCKKGYEPIISITGLHQIHLLLFFLAAFHVFYSAFTMMFGRLKIRGWKKWEAETYNTDSDVSNSDASRFRLTRETSFVKAHTSYWTKIPFYFYIGCFLRQFFRSVSKADYVTLRHGFIAVHIAPGTNFNFQKYIKRSLEDDFKTVVGVSPVLWASFVIFLLLNVSGWQALFWASLIPVIIILAVGTKLQAVMTKMALEIEDRHAVVQGIPLVQGSDKYFWFGRPHLVLHLIHFALFQNAFQITYFLWIWYCFGLKSCFHSNFKLVIAKLALGVAAMFLCSYITLPLYALVVQMGSHMKKSIFDEQTSKAIKKWHMDVKKKQGDGTTIPTSPAPAIGGGNAPFSATGHSNASNVHDSNLPARVNSADSLIITVEKDQQNIEMAENQNQNDKRTHS